MPMRPVMKGTKIYIAVSSGSTPAVVNSDLDQAGFEALTWQEATQAISIGEYGRNSNMLSQDELATTVTQKQKGVTNLGDPAIDFSRSLTDVGQAALRNAGLETYNDNVAVKFAFDDKQTAGGTSTVDYVRAVVSGPVKLNGGVDDFIRERFTLGLNQLLTINGSDA